MKNSTAYPMHRCRYNAKRTKDCPYIPEPIVFDILSRVSAQDLVRYKTVCKLWRSLIDDPDFIDLHKSRAQKSAIGSTKYCKYSKFFPGGIDIFLSSKRHGPILGSSSFGLVCIRTGKKKYCVCNPATLKSFQLPPLKFDTYAMEMRVYSNSQSRQFNVVALCKYYSSVLHRFPIFFWSIFTIGVDCEWRYFEHSTGDHAVRWSAAVLCENAPIFLVQYDAPEYEMMAAFRLDPFTGEVRTQTAPFHLNINLVPYYFGYERKMLLSAHEWDGKFSLSSFDDQTIQTWILDDYDKNDWRFEAINAPRKEELGFNCLHSICFVQEGKMWLRTRSRTRDLFSLDLFTDKVEKITNNAMQICDFEPYQSTLMTLGPMK